MFSPSRTTARISLNAAWRRCYSTPDTTTASITHAVDEALVNAAAKNEWRGPRQPRAKPSLRRSRFDSALGPFAYIRPWKGVPSMPAGLAVLREVERKYGKVATVFFHRDPEVLGGYKPFFMVKFDASVPHDGISMEGEVFKARVPRAPKLREGGIGLDDLQGILYHDADLAAQEADSRNAAAGVEGVDWDLEDVRIAQSPYHFLRPSKQLSLSPERYLQFADKWTAWGGFSTPLNSSTRHVFSAHATEEIPLVVRSPDLDLANIKYRTISHANGRIPEPPPTAAQNPAPEPESQKIEEALEEEIFAEAEVAPLEWKPLRFDRQDLPSAADVDASQAEAEADASKPAKHAEKPLAQMSRRERILYQARVNARTPLPSVDEEAQKAEEARKAEEETKAKAESIRQRLWKLMGGQAS